MLIVASNTLEAIFFIVSKNKQKRCQATMKVDQNESNENKMGTMAINRLILSMSLPMMISMLIQALYNIVDSIFVAQLNEQALTAVSLAFPVQNLMIAVQVGTGVGINALLSRQLGQGKKTGARQTAANGIALAFLHYAVFLVLGLIFSALFFENQTSDPLIRQYGTTYLRIATILSLGQFLQVTFDRLLQSTGQSLYTMYTQATGAIINIILDPILIFGLFGFPRLEVAGAAYATVIAQFVAAALGFYFHRKHNRQLPLSLAETLHPDKSTIREIYKVGVPSMVMTSITSVTTYFLNVILMSFSSTATAVYGIYFKLQSFAFMPVFGLNNGTIPILSYNFGARNHERMQKIIQYSIIYAMVIMLLSLALFQIFPVQLLGFFNASEEMLEYGIPALRTISLSFILAGFSVMCGTIFQAFGRGFLSLSVSVLRQLVVLIPTAFLLSRTGNVNLIWWAYPISELFSAALCAFFLRYILKKYVQPLPVL